MSSKPKLPLSPELSWGDGMILQDHQFQNAEGRILTIVESLGLPTTQETAAKSLVRQELWALYREGHYIPAEDHTLVRRKLADEEHRHILSGTKINPVE